MYYTYVLLSEKDGTKYVGSTENVTKRLKEHNQGVQRFTKGHRPWKLIYSESFETKREARCRENFFKTTVGRRELNNIVCSLEAKEK